MRTHLLASLLIAAACRSNDPGAGSLRQNASAAFKDCSASEIGFLAAKNGVQLAFAACASNAFSSYTWSPDGRRVYFQLVFTGHIMDAEKAHKPIVALAIPTPKGPGVWLTNERVALPVAGVEADDPLQLALIGAPPFPGLGEALPPIDVSVLPLGGLVRVAETQRGAGEGELLILGSTTAEGPLSAYRYLVAEARLEPMLPWLPVDTTSLSWQVALDRVVVGRAESVEVREASSGAVLSTWSPARRGTLHPDGRWLVLEHLGEPVSVFAAPARGDVPEEVAAREAARAQAFADRLPPGMNTTVRPPQLSVADLTTGRRVLLTGIQGERFMWYEAAIPYANFFLWGFEGRSLKRNVGLVDLSSHLDAIDGARERMGHAPMSGIVPTAPAPADP